MVSNEYGFSLGFVAGEGGSGIWLALFERVSRLTSGFGIKVALGSNEVGSRSCFSFVSAIGVDGDETTEGLIDEGGDGPCFRQSKCISS